MSTSINSLDIHRGMDVSYRSSFKRMVEEHLDHIRLEGHSDVFHVETGMQVRRECDFYGLLNELGVDPWLHYVTLRINGFDSPLEYKPFPGQVLVGPDHMIMDGLMRRYMTARTSNK